MPRPPAARQKVLQAYAHLLATQGEQAATLDAVAESAGVSKGGLLYHFPTREALVDGLLEQLNELGQADIEAMNSADEGPVQYYLRSSAEGAGEFNEFYVAASRLGGVSAERAQVALQRQEVAWYSSIQRVVGDPALARAIALIGDGLYLKVVQGQKDQALVQRREVAEVVESWLGE